MLLALTIPSSPIRDEDLHKIMDINKVFPKPPEVEESLRRQRVEQELADEAAELARVKALAPAIVPPTKSQLMAAQIGQQAAISCQ